MLDLVSVLGGTMRTEDLADLAWETWFARPTRLRGPARSTTARGVVGRVWRRGWLFCGICALLAGRTLLKSRV